MSLKSVEETGETEKKKKLIHTSKTYKAEFTQGYTLQWKWSLKINECLILSHLIPLRKKGLWCFIVRF